MTDRRVPITNPKTHEQTGWAYLNADGRLDYSTDMDGNKRDSKQKLTQGIGEGGNSHDASAFNTLIGDGAIKIFHEEGMVYYHDGRDQKQWVAGVDPIAKLPDGITKEEANKFAAWMTKKFKSMQKPSDKEVTDFVEHAAEKYVKETSGQSQESQQSNAGPNQAENNNTNFSREKAKIYADVLAEKIWTDTFKGIDAPNRPSENDVIKQQMNWIKKEIASSDLSPEEKQMVMKQLGKSLRDQTVKAQQARKNGYTSIGMAVPSENDWTIDHTKQTMETIANECDKSPNAPSPQQGQSYTPHSTAKPQAMSYNGQGQNDIMNLIGMVLKLFGFELPNNPQTPPQYAVAQAHHGNKAPSTASDGKGPTVQTGRG